MKQQYMDLGTFRKLGYLQELNRLFLHPLGMALAFESDEKGNTTVAGIWDNRGEPGGIIFGDGVLDSGKAARVAQHMKEGLQSRDILLNYGIQPVPVDTSVA